MLTIMNEDNKIELVSKLRDDNAFELLNIEKGITIEFFPPLQLMHDYDTENYSLYIFFNNYHPENEIYQVYEKILNKRIGWVFPINALTSNDHDFSTNPHFLRYATIAYKKLLGGLYECKSPTYENDKEFSLTHFYADNAILLVLSNAVTSELDDFDIKNYYPSLFLYGFSLVEESLITLRNTEEAKKITLKKTKEIFKEDIFLHQLFMELLPRSNHHLVRFHLLYQVIELVIEKIFHIEFRKTLSQIEESDITLFEIKDQIGELTNEQFRIKKLFGIYFQFNIQEKVILHNSCNELLSNNSFKTYTDLNKSLYKVRNLLVHSYRNVPGSSIDTIDRINSSFEIVLITMLTTIEGLD